MKYYQNLGECCKLLQQGPGQAPGQKRFGAFLGVTEHFLRKDNPINMKTCARHVFNKLLTYLFSYKTDIFNFQKLFVQPSIGAGPGTHAPMVKQPKAVKVVNVRHNSRW